MIENKIESSRNLEKALQALEQTSTRFSIVKRRKWQSAVEKASYRTKEK